MAVMANRADIAYFGTSDCPITETFLYHKLILARKKFPDCILMPIILTWRPDEFRRLYYPDQGTGERTGTVPSMGHLDGNPTRKSVRVPRPEWAVDGILFIMPSVGAAIAKRADRNQK